MLFLQEKKISRAPQRERIQGMYSFNFENKGHPIENFSETLPDKLKFIFSTERTDSGDAFIQIRKTKKGHPHVP